MSGIYYYPDSYEVRKPQRNEDLIAIDAIDCLMSAAVKATKSAAYMQACIGRNVGGYSYDAKDLCLRVSSILSNYLRIDSMPVPVELQRDRYNVLRDMGGCFGQDVEGS